MTGPFRIDGFDWTTEAGGRIVKTRPARGAQSTNQITKDVRDLLALKANNLATQLISLTDCQSRFDTLTQEVADLQTLLGPP